MSFPDLTPVLSAAKSRLFMHSVLGAYPGDMLAGVSVVDRYGARVLASTEPGDVVLLHPDIELAHTDAVTEHYERVGLEVATDHIYDESLDIARQYPDFELSVFLYGREANAVSPRQEFCDLAEKMNNKNTFIRRCQELGLPTPNTVCFDSRAEAVDCVVPLRFPVYVKGAVSASGQHVVEVNDRSQMQSVIMEQMPEEFQVQEALPEGTRFYNIQYARNRYGRFEQGPLTVQILEDKCHVGNRFPAGIDPDLVQPITDRLSKILFKEGIEGVWAFDVAVNGTDVWLIEMNPRWNGATYYSIPAERLGVSAWEGLNVEIAPCDLPVLLNHHVWRSLEFSQTNRQGIVLINWATSVGGKLGLLVIGTEDQRTAMLEKFRATF